uniref:Uncharacterized protein n=1 Tax=Anguilla anguilla TaxID=7936 RepID=A0A0E9V639_ANGAN
MKDWCLKDRHTYRQMYIHFDTRVNTHPMP